MKVFLDSWFFYNCHTFLLHLLQDLVDIEIFYEAKRVMDALRNKEVAPALAWCADNKSRLKKSKVYYTYFFNLVIATDKRKDT